MKVNKYLGKRKYKVEIVTKFWLVFVNLQYDDCTVPFSYMVIPEQNAPWKPTSVKFISYLCKCINFDSRKCLVLKTWTYVSFPHIFVKIYSTFLRYNSSCCCVLEIKISLSVSLQKPVYFSGKPACKLKPGDKLGRFRSNLPSE